MKKYSGFISVLGFTILLLIVFEVSSPKKIDWSLSFSSEDKIPYGSYILYRSLTELFPGKKITAAYYPAYNSLYQSKYTKSGYIFLNDEFFPDELDSRELINFVKDGNYVFACSNYFRGKLFDSLKTETNINYFNKDSAEINFFSDSLKNKTPYHIKKSYFEFYFSRYDTLYSEVLGINKDNKANFIRTSFGKGYFYMCTVPEAFTNLTLMDSINSDYAYKSVSFLPADLKIIWDEYYKINKSMIRTPLRYILSQESLQWSYYILIFSIVIYIIFQGKRKQRIIPVIIPLKNTTLEFVKLIGKLYFQQKDHKNIAEKKINFFLDYLRNRYFVKTDELNPESVEKISLKSGVDKGDVKVIFNYINYIDICEKIKEEELQRINFLIESFYKKTGAHGRSK